MWSLLRAADASTPRSGPIACTMSNRLFGGFEVLDSGIKLALPEEALVDFLYLSPTRSRLFASLPEVELPRGFRRSAAREWVRRIPSARLRTIVARRLDEVLMSRS